MKVLLISNSLPTKRYPLHGRVLEDAKALSLAGIDTVVAAVDLRSIRRLRRYGITHDFYLRGGGYTN